MIDYLSGLTQSEAMHFIQHLPNPSQEELAILKSLVHRKPITRQGSAAESRETTNLRIRYLVEYLKTTPKGATRLEIDQALKYNGANMRRTIAEATRRGLIQKITKGHKVNIFKVTKKGVTKWKTPRES